jgi:hypothetical protein
VAAKELGRFFVGAETERGYAGLGGRRIAAVQRGAVLEEIRSTGGENPRLGQGNVGSKRFGVGMDTTQERA